LHETANDFIQRLLRAHGETAQFPLDTIDVRRQYNNMDVVVVLNGTAALLIEDKVHASAHSGQLDRYHSTLADEFGEEHVFPIYLKTGDQSNYRKARKQGYRVFSRSDLLDILRDGLDRGVTSDIFENYYDHLSSIDAQVKSFESAPMDDWARTAWKGFYQRLQEQLGSGNWNYVSNPSGGFMGYWWHFSESNGCKQYLQLQEDQLCFKIEVEDEDEYKRLRTKWHNKIVAAASEAPIDAVKPDRFGYGKHMTVAVIPEDYRATDEEGILDIAETLQRLQHAEGVLTRAVEG